MLFYSSGIVLVFGLYALSYVYAWHRRDALGLDEVERFVTKVSLRAHLISVGIGLLSIGLALAGFLPLSRLIYFLMPVAHGLHGWRSGVKVDRLVEMRGVPAEGT